MATPLAPRTSSYPTTFAPRPSPNHPHPSPLAPLQVTSLALRDDEYTHCGYICSGYTNLAIYLLVALAILTWLYTYEVASLALRDDDFAWITAEVAALGVPTVSVLEGGYNTLTLTPTPALTLTPTLTLSLSLTPTPILTLTPGARGRL